MSKLRIANVVGSPPWYVVQGLCFGWIGAAGAGDRTRSWLFAVGFAMILLMLPFEIWRHRRQATAAKDLREPAHA